ncbi:MAG: hypothetical protein KBT68_07720, partial [bacterium]|nr:hypothetical protein [Candidatus Colisoma equi]
MKKLMVGLFAVAVATGVYGADQVTWFEENAMTVAAALEGKTEYGTWAELDGLSADGSQIVIDADAESPVTYTPDAELEGDAATLTFTDVT